MRHFPLVIGLFAAATLVSDPALAQPASRFALQGEEDLTEAHVRRALDRYAISLEAPIDAPTADDAAFYLSESLRGQGFPDASVEYAFVDDVLIFETSRGTRYHVGQVHFLGGEGLSSARRKAVFDSAMRQSTLTPFGAVEYVQRAVEAASDTLEGTFQSEGFIDASVQVTPTFGDRTVDLAVTIDQGPQALVQSVKVRGDAIPADLVAAARGSEGQIYFPSEEAILRSALLGGLREKGFYDATVQSRATVGWDGRVSITLDATTGLQYRLGRVKVTGTRHSRAHALLGRMGLPRGKPYDVSAVDAAVRRLWFTGAFDTIETETRKSGDGTLDLLVHVEEGRAKQISATVGYGQWEQGFATLTYTDRNFFGTLNRLVVTGLISSRSFGISAGLSDPWLFRTDATGTIGGLFLRRETPAYKSTFYGINLGIERRFDKRATTAWRAGIKWLTTSNTTVFSKDAREETDADFRLGQITFGQTLDRRNDPLIPMAGYLLSWDGSVASPALLGDLSFGKFEAQATGYLPLLEILPERTFVPFLAFNHRVAVIVPYGNTREIPVQERFFLGGPDTVRSFLYDGMAPRDKQGNPSGGLLSLLVNAELQVPIWRALFGVAFLDVGNLAPTISDFTWDDTRVALGLGARLYTPLGAIRIDYGANLIRGPGDPIGAWQFGFGFTF